MPRDNRSHAKDALTALLKSMREGAGLRQVDLAKRLKQPQSFVSKYESGERRLDILEVMTVCEALNTTFRSFAQRLEEALDEA